MQLIQTLIFITGCRYELDAAESNQSLCKLCIFSCLSVDCQVRRETCGRTQTSQVFEEVFFSVCEVGG